MCYFQRIIIRTDYRQNSSRDYVTNPYGTYVFGEILLKNRYTSWICYWYTLQWQIRFHTNNDNIDQVTSTQLILKVSNSCTTNGASDDDNEDDYVHVAHVVS